MSVYKLHANRNDNPSFELDITINHLKFETGFLLACFVSL